MSQWGHSRGEEVREVVKETLMSHSWHQYVLSSDSATVIAVVMVELVGVELILLFECLLCVGGVVSV